MITLDEAKRHLRVDHTEEDSDIARKLKQADWIVTQYVDSSSANEDIKDAATMLVLGELYANREASTANLLTPSIKAMLATVRTPGIA